MYTFNKKEYEELRNYKKHLEEKAEARNNIINNYIDIANSKLKIAKNFSVNYFGNCIPKNAVYGRATKSLYVYVDDFQQFHPIYKNTKFTIYILNSRKDAHFKKTIVSKHTEWYKMLYAYIEYHKLYSVKCIPVNCINRADGKPMRKEPQTKTGYNYTTGLYSQNRVDPYCYECIDTDVTRKIDRYAFIDKQKMYR